MTWFKVDDNLAFHPKAVTAGNAALGLWVRAGSWSSQQLTDGFVPDAIVAALGGNAQARALVTAGLWDKQAGGYQFHDWTQCNPTRAEQEAKREARAAAGQAGGKASGKARAQAKKEAPVEANASQSVDDLPVTRANPRPDPSRSLQTPTESAAPAPPTTADETLAQRAQRLTRTYTDRVKISNFPAVMGVVRKAINASHDDQAITAALERLAAEGRTVTADTLRIELEGMPPARQTGRVKPSTTDARVAAVDDAVAAVLARTTPPAQDRKALGGAA